MKCGISRWFEYRKKINEDKYVRVYEERTKGVDSSGMPPVELINRADEE